MRSVGAALREACGARDRWRPGAGCAESDGHTPCRTDRTRGARPRASASPALNFLQSRCGAVAGLVGAPGHAQAQAAVRALSCSCSCLQGSADASLVGLSVIVACSAGRKNRGRGTGLIYKKIL
jgi:hypothetical protein